MCIRDSRYPFCKRGVLFYHYVSINYIFSAFNIRCRGIVAQTSARPSSMERLDCFSYACSGEGTDLWFVFYLLAGAFLCSVAQSTPKLDGLCFYSSRFPLMDGGRLHFSIFEIFVCRNSRIGPLPGASFKTRAPSLVHAIISS